MAAPTTTAVTAAAGPLAVEVVDDLDAVDGVWDSLAATGDDVFATRAWLATWWTHFGRERPLRLALLRDPADDGRVVALVPLYLASGRPLRTLRFLGHGPTDRLGPICAVPDRARVQAALPQVLAAIDGWDLAIADELPDLGAVPDDATLLGRSPTHSISLDGVSGDDWFAARTPKLRHQLRHAERTLAAMGEVTFRTADDPDRLDRDLDALLDLHHRHWARRPGGSRAYVGRAAFHRDVARRFLANGWLRLHVLELDGEPVAALHNLWFDGVESNYQGGRDPALDRCSLGLLIHERAIRAAAEAGTREYRFLRGDEPYKLRLADRTEQQISLAWTASGVGRAGRSAVAQLPRLSRRRARWVPAPWAWGTGGSPRSGATVIVEPVHVDRTPEGLARRSARLRWDDQELVLAVEGPPEHLDPTDDASSPAVAALAFAMRKAPGVQVQGPIDPVLADHVEEIEAAYLAWDLQATPVGFGAALPGPHADRPEGKHRRAAFFSRGVDSIYTAARDRAGARALDALVFVDGLEPLHGPEGRAAEIRHAQETAHQLELPLVVVRTNVRELFDPAGFDWEDAVGAGLASVALALARAPKGRRGGRDHRDHRTHHGFDEVVIPSGDSWASVEPCGTSPLLDPLFSTSRVRIIHDSLARTRLGKVGWLVAHRPDLLPGIKVCFREDRPDNCGRCGKCLLTMVCLLIHGALDRATAFPSTIDPDDIRAFRLPHLKARLDWAEVAGVLGTDGVEGEIRAAALDTIRTSALTGPDQADQQGRAVWAGPWWLRNHRLNQTLSLVVDGTPYPPLPGSG